ncbi:MAG: ABC transporter permease [Candidatus Thorarchaeota archaeon]
MSLANRALRNVFRKKTRTLLVALALGFTIAAILSVYTGIDASTTNTQNMIDDYKNTINRFGDLSETQERLITVSAGRGGFGEGGFGGVGFPGGSQEPVNEDMVENISSIDYVEDVFPIINQPMGEINIEEMREQMRPSEGGFEPGQGGFEKPNPENMVSLFDYIIQGVPLDSELDEKYSILPSNIVSGRKITEGDSGKVMIREELTDSDGYFSGAHVGSYITIEDTYFKVVGIYSSDDNRNNVYMSLSDARNVLGMEKGNATSINVYATTKSVVDLVVYDIEELYSNYRATSTAEMSSRFADRIQMEQEQEINSLQADNEKIESSGNQIIFISIITAVLIVLFLMLYTVKERIKEIGILKALGFPGKNIMVQFIIEGTIIGFIGGVIGITIGIIGGPFISEFLLPDTNVFATSTPSLNMILMILIFTIALGAIGTIYPAWEASRKHPVEAIRHE